MWRNKMISIKKLKFIGLAYIVWESFLLQFYEFGEKGKKPTSLRRGPRISLEKKVYFI